MVEVRGQPNFSKRIFRSGIRTVPPSSRILQRPLKGL